MPIGNSQLNNILARVVTLIGTHPLVDTEQVHAGFRDLWDPATWEQLFWDRNQDLFSGWMVHRVSSERVELTRTTSFLEQRPHTIRIAGWMEVDDPQTGQQATSSATWNTITEDICTLIREDLWKSTPLNITNCGGGEPPVVTVDEHRDIPMSIDGDDLSSTRCHYCEIEFKAIERIVWA